MPLCLLLLQSLVEGEDRALLGRWSECVVGFEQGPNPLFLRWMRKSMKKRMMPKQERMKMKRMKKRRRRRKKMRKRRMVGGKKGKKRSKQGSILKDPCVGG